MSLAGLSSLVNLGFSDFRSVMGVLGLGLPLAPKLLLLPLLGLLFLPFVFSFIDLPLADGLELQLQMNGLLLQLILGYLLVSLLLLQLDLLYALRAPLDEALPLAHDLR